MNEAVEKITRWRKNPLAFVRECFGAEPDPWQAEVLQAFPSNQRIALKAAKGCGKSTILAWLAWNFLATRPYPKIAATSISGDNLADGLWAEVAKWQSRSELLKKTFTWTKTRIVNTQEPENWWMSARSWPRGADPSQQANTLAGLHADYLMFILDESGGIPEGVMAAAEAGLSTGTETKLVQCGNPTHLEGPLYAACTKERHLWFVQEITGDPDDPKRSPRISLQWAREQIEKYGADNPFVLVNVFGRFPPSSLNALLGPDEVMAAMRRKLSPEEYEWSQKRLGVDCARFGDDRTVLFPRQGLMAFPPVEMRNARTNEIAARVMQAKAKWGSEMEFVDGTGGYGAGVVDGLLQAGCSPLEIHFSGKPIDPRYLNKRAEMFFLMAEWVKRGGSLPDRPGLVRELTAPAYTFQNGKLKLEEKEQIKSRLGFSCDEADALALTFALPDMPANASAHWPGQQRGRMAHEWEPYQDEIAQPRERIFRPT